MNGSALPKKALRSLAAVAAAGLVVAPAAVAGASSSSGSSSFSHTGALQTWTVPTGVKSILVVMVGGRGGKGGVSWSGPGQGPPSAAAKVTMRIPVAPGDELTVGVGGNGSDGTQPWQAPPAGGVVAVGLSSYAGGAGGRGYNYPNSHTGGGSGGAATFITVDGTDYVAGGGGGGGGDGTDSVYSISGGSTTRTAWDWRCGAWDETNPLVPVCTSWSTASLTALFTTPLGKHVPDLGGSPITSGGPGYGYQVPVPSPDGATSVTQSGSGSGGGGGGGGGVRGGIGGYFGLDYSDSAQPGTRGQSTSGDGVTVADATLTESGSVVISWSLPAAPTLSGAPTGISNAESASITITGEEGATFECDRDGISRGPCESPWVINGLESGDWPSVTVPGQHKMMVRQIDRYGQAGPWAQVEWFTDRTPPAMPAFAGAPPAVTNSRSATFTFAATPPSLPDGVTCATIISAGFPCGDTFECRIDGGTWQDCSSPVALANLPDGNHSFELRADDGSGNLSDTARSQWTVRQFSAPTVTAVAPRAVRTAGRWVITLGSTFNPSGDPRGAAQPMTVQISTATPRPSDSQPIPTRPSYAEGIVAWAAEVSRQSIARPRWVRAGNRAGLWTGWVAIR